MSKRKKINKKKVAAVTIGFVVIISLCFYVTLSIFSMVSPEKEKTSPKKETSTNEDRVSFVAVGDNIIHENVFQYAKKQSSTDSYNFKPCYQNVKKYIQNKDLAYINQETIISGDQNKIQGYPTFNSPESLIDDLEDTGFQLVSTASNHSMDQGLNGLFYSCQIWRQHSNMLMSGIYDSQGDRDTIRVIEKNNIRFSFLSYTFGVNQYSNYNKISRQLKQYPYALAQFDEEQITNDITKAKELSDVVIVSAHWGVEGKSEVTDFQKKYAQLFADLNVDLVIGSHNHLLQPMETLEGTNGHETLVIYSLGNFLSTMKDVDNQLEGMVTLDFVRKENEIVIENVTYIPLINHFNDQIVTIYALKDYNDTLRSQHSILKDQNDILKTFKSNVKKIIPENVEIEM